MLFVSRSFLPSKKSVNDDTLVYLVPPFLAKQSSMKFNAADSSFVLTVAGLRAQWCFGARIGMLTAFKRGTGHQHCHGDSRKCWAFQCTMEAECPHKTMHDASQLLYKLHLAQEAVSNWVAVCRSRGTCCT